jgi:hypothetical protein
MIRRLPLDAATYQRSSLHSEDRIWQETNCYVDLWIEALHALGIDPASGLAFTLSADFEGDQWQFVKYPTEDLRALYGLDVAEMNPWRGLEHHTEEQLSLGRWTTAEVDSWYLPDTAGVSYGIEHVKTSIVPNMIDRDARRLGYFHGAGYHELEGDDFDGIFRRGTMAPEVLSPYVELIRFDHFAVPGPDELADRVLATVADHLARRPATNPVERMAQRFERDVDWLRDEGMATFHGYAFVTLRQCGATAELAASLCGWLGDRGHPVSGAADELTALAAGCKSVQFKLARLAAGRDVDLAGMVGSLAHHWDDALVAVRALTDETVRV